MKLKQGFRTPYLLCMTFVLLQNSRFFFSTPTSFPQQAQITKAQIALMCYFFFLNPPCALAIFLFLNCVTKLFWGLDLRSQHLEDKVFLIGQGMLWKEESNNTRHNKQLTLKQRCSKQTQGTQAQIRDPKGESSNLIIWKISYNQFWPGVLSWQNLIGQKSICCLLYMFLSVIC